MTVPPGPGGGRIADQVGRARRGHSGGRRTALALGIVIVMLLAADLSALRRHNRTPVGTSEAVRRFHIPQPLPQDPVVGFEQPTTTTDPAGTAASSSTVVAPTVPTVPSVPASAAAGTSTSVSPTARPPALRPPAGVYRYRTVGFEELGIGGSRTYPELTTRTVRTGAGCAWTMEIVLLDEHREQHLMCGTAQVLDLLSTRTDVRWFGVSYPTEFTCSPRIRHVDRSARDGDVVAFRCSESGGATFTGTSTLGRIEAFNFQGESRPAWRLRIDGKFDGRTRGTVSAVELIDEATGRVLSEERTNDLKQTTVIGDVTYRQEVRLTLVSLTPET